MNRHKRPKQSFRHRALAVFDGAVRLARSTLREYERNRMHHLDGVWVFAMVAKTIASARSVRALILARQYWDAKLIIRSMYDSMVDVAYVLHDPSQRRKLEKLFKIEMAVDRKEWLDYAARRDNVQASQLRPNQLNRGEIEREYRWAIAQPEFGATRGQWPKRWKAITQDEKIRAIRSEHDSWRDLFDYSVKALGNAAAHGRSIVLQAFLREGQEPGRVKFTTKPSLPLDLAKERLLIIEPLVCLMGVSMAVINSFRLGDAYERRWRRLHDDWVKLVSPPRPGAWGVPHRLPSVRPRGMNAAARERRPGGTT